MAHIFATRQPPRSSPLPSQARASRTGGMAGQHARNRMATRRGHEPAAGGRPWEFTGCRHVWITGRGRSAGPRTGRCVEPKNFRPCNARNLFAGTSAGWMHEPDPRCGCSSPSHTTGRNDLHCQSADRATGPDLLAMAAGSAAGSDRSGGDRHRRSCAHCRCPSDAALCSGNWGPPLGVALGSRRGASRGSGVWLCRDARSG